VLSRDGENGEPSNSDRQPLAWITDKKGRVMMRIPVRRVKMIGLGGIGGCLAPFALRYLNFAHPGCEVSFIDGDNYELRNRERQAFTELGNKADVTARRFRDEFPALTIIAHPVYVTEENIVSLIRDGDIVFMGVDNHATRKTLSDRAGELDNILLISGGNELTHGNVQVHLRVDGEDLTLPIANEYHPEIQQPGDRNPAELDCDENLTQLPQLLPMNLTIAACMLNAFYGVTVHDRRYEEVYVDILTNDFRPVDR
jgi:molybdopterin/thiamine biosynthesis adenylyltransferase